eukprot:12449760-Alexandrium_andersonii.AAC.1
MGARCQVTGAWRSRTCANRWSCASEPFGCHSVTRFWMVAQREEPEQGFARLQASAWRSRTRSNHGAELNSRS